MFDIAVLAVVAVLTLLGLWKGLVRQIVGLAGVAAGYVIATKFYGPLAAKFLTGFRPATGRVISFLAIFIACIIAASIIGWIAEKLMNTAGLGILNRIGGGILGAVKGYLIVSVVVMMMVSFLPLHSGVFKGSRTMKYIQPMAGIVSRFAPESISKRYEERAAKMRRFYFDGDTMRRTRDKQFRGRLLSSFSGRWPCGCSLAPSRPAQSRLRWSLFPRRRVPYTSSGSPVAKPLAPIGRLSDDIAFSLKAGNGVHS